MKTMKKIGILAIVLLLGLASCGIGNPDPMFEQRFVKPKGTKEVKFTDGTTMFVRRFTYEGHNYIEFFRNMPYDNYTGYLHDPDCPCLKK